MHLGDRDMKRRRRKLFLKDEKDPRKSWKGGDQREYTKLQEYHKIAKITVIERIHLMEVKINTIRKYERLKA